MPRCRTLALLTLTLAGGETPLRQIGWGHPITGAGQQLTALGLPAVSHAVAGIEPGTQRVQQRGAKSLVGVGELQRTFNEMAENLQLLVAASTQKELLEKELALARDLQNSLIPSDLPSGEGVEFATLFEPSAAIGGDYFDVLRLSDSELAVIIADVSGHGLSTGLRMGRSAQFRCRSGNWRKKAPLSCLVLCAGRSG